MSNASEQQPQQRTYSTTRPSAAAAEHAGRFTTFNTLLPSAGLYPRFGFHLSSARAPIYALMLMLSFALLSTLPSAARANELTLTVGYLELIQHRPPLLSNVLPEPEDSGLQGAQLGLSDNNAGGRFLGQKFVLEPFRSDSIEALQQTAKQWHQQGITTFVVNLPAAELRQLAASFKPGEALLFNIGSSSNALRNQQCLSNVLHTLPSRAMLTDALAQWLSARRLKEWFLIHGQRPGDLAYRDSLKRSAKRFGGKIVAQKPWSFDTDLRRVAQREVPLFTQGEDYDTIVVADELGDFGEFILYNTWLPRPVVGTQGLTAVGWHRVVEQWGAAQLQSRFDKQAKRWMNSTDYAAWIALRSVGEALAQQGKTDAKSLQQLLLSEQFQLAGFKGRKLSYRSWNGQLRQPIALVHPRALVSQSPQQGFLHPRTELDTLGFDQPESQCQNLLDGVNR
ncbi:MAG: ABC transporter substrate-binding protein [Motiliproteus sp.]